MASATAASMTWSSDRLRAAGMAWARFSMTPVAASSALTSSGSDWIFEKAKNMAEQVTCC